MSSPIAKQDLTDEGAKLLPTREWDVDTFLNHTRIGFIQFRLWFLASMMLMMDAMATVSVRYLASSLDNVWLLGDTMRRVLTPLLFVGMFIGSFTAGRASDNYGRRVVAMVGMAVTASGSLMMTLAKTPATACLGIMITGAGVASGHVGQTLISEFSPPIYRDIVVTAWGSMWSAGLVCSTLLAELMFPYAVQWRAYAFTLMLPPLLVAIMMYAWLPESPRYLLLRQRRREATALLLDHAKQTGSLHRFPPNIVLRSLPPQQKVPSAIDLLRSKTIGPITMLISYLWFVFTGLYYGAVLTQSASSVDLLYISMGEYCVYIIQLFIGRVLGHRVGMVVLMLLMLVVFATHFILTPSLSLLILTRIALSSAYFFMWIFSPNLFPTNVRSTGIGIANCSARVAGIIVPTLSLLLSPTAYTCIAIFFLSIGTIGCAIFLRNTTNRSLTEILD